MTGNHPHTCSYYNGDHAYHRREAQRIAGLFATSELAAYTEDGPVKTILRERIAQERERGMEQPHGAVTDRL